MIVAVRVGRQFVKGIQVAIGIIPEPLVGGLRSTAAVCVRLSRAHLGVCNRNARGGRRLRTCSLIVPSDEQNLTIRMQTTAIQAAQHSELPKLYSAYLFTRACN